MSSFIQKGFYKFISEVLLLFFIPIGIAFFFLKKKNHFLFFDPSK